MPPKLIVGLKLPQGSRAHSWSPRPTGAPGATMGPSTGRGAPVGAVALGVGGRDCGGDCIFCRFSGGTRAAAGARGGGGGGTCTALVCIVYECATAASAGAACDTSPCEASAGRPEHAIGYGDCMAGADATPPSAAGCPADARESDLCECLVEDRPDELLIRVPSARP